MIENTQQPCSLDVIGTTGVAQSVKDKAQWALNKVGDPLYVTASSDGVVHVSSVREGQEGMPPAPKSTL